LCGAVLFRKPFLTESRSWLTPVIFTVSLGLILIEVWWFYRTKLIQKISHLLILILACSGFAIAAHTEADFQWVKQTVLTANPSSLEKLGQHFIVGYRNLEEAKALVERRAIAGVFITTRNIQHKTKAEIRDEIRSLQAIRQTQGLSPLWIATDQEGGIVSRLSPPLTPLPPLASIVNSQAAIASQKDAVFQYAHVHGKELSELGINLNFAPVVDLNKQIVNPSDRYSRIYQRAISADKTIVAQVASWYCDTLASHHVHCTLKHFPGLGRINNDTHVEEAQLPTPIATLVQDDWVPFRTLMGHVQAFVMLGHARLMAIDADHPVSFSKAVITDLIRDQWHYQGILVTDDFCMQAVYGSNDGVGKASLTALNSGVDLILLSFDPDLYYDAMNALLKAEKTGSVKNEPLATSQQRLTYQWSGSHDQPS